MDDPFRFDTLAVHAGRTVSPNTLEAFETQLAALEGAGVPSGGVWSLGLSSGRAAVDAVARLLRPGDRVILSEEINPRTLEVLLPYGEFGIAFEFRDLTDPSRWRFRNTSLVWLESPGGVNLGVVNLSSVARRAHDSGALVVVDNSSLTAYSSRPLEHSADLVVYSSMGGLTGNAALKFGALFGRDFALHERLHAHRDLMATKPDANVLEGASMGVSSLSARLERQSRLAFEFAKRLWNQPGIRRVFYPGLDAHRGHAIAVQQMRLHGGRPVYGSVFSLRLESSEMAQALPTLTRLWQDSSRVGSTRSSVVQPASQVNGLNVPTDIVRLSVGLEDEADLWNDLERALNAVRELRANTLAAQAANAELAAAKALLETAAVENVAVVRNTNSDSISAQNTVQNDVSLDINAKSDVVIAPQATTLMIAETIQPSFVAKSDEPDEPQGSANTFEPASQDPIASLNSTELDRYARLREWRDTQALRLELSRFQIASNALLSGIAHANPDSIQALEGVKGFGAERLRRYGTALLAVSRGEIPLDSMDSETPPNAPVSDAVMNEASSTPAVVVVEPTSEPILELRIPTTRTQAGSKRPQRARVEPIKTLTSVLETKQLELREPELKAPQLSIVEPQAIQSVIQKKLLETRKPKLKPVSVQSVVQKPASKALKLKVAKPKQLKATPVLPKNLEVKQATRTTSRSKKTVIHETLTPAVAIAKPKRIKPMPAPAPTEAIIKRRVPSRKAVPTK